MLPPVVNETFIPLVNAIAGNVVKRLPRHVRKQDLAQEGWLGLLAAKRDYKSNKSVPFSAYAPIRIKGAMLDSLRRDDWVSRNARKQAKKDGISPAVHLANELVDFDQIPVYCDDDQLSRCIKLEVSNRLSKEIERLNPREQFVVKLYFYEGLTQREIGKILGVVPSRVSQIIFNAIKSMKNGLESRGF